MEAERADCRYRSLDKMRRIKRGHTFVKDHKYNQLALTFWTCLQLERCVESSELLSSSMYTFG